VIATKIEQHSRSARHSIRTARVVDRGTEKRPFSMLGLLSKREDVNFVTAPYQPFDEPEQTGNNSFDPAAIHAPGSYNRYFHLGLPKVFV
jgi:hypothetical protein